MTDINDWVDDPAPASTSIAAQPQGHQINDWVDDAPHQQPSLYGDIKNDLSLRATNYLKSGDNTTFGALAQGYGAAGDIGGELLKRTPIPAIVNSAVNAEKPIAQGVANAVDSTGAGQWAGDNLMQARDTISGFLKDNPKVAQRLENIKDIASGDAAITGANSLRKGLASAGENAASALERPSDVFPTTAAAPAPPAIRNYDAVKQANESLAANTQAHYKNVNTIGAELTPEASQYAKDLLQNEVGDNLDEGLHRQTLGALRIFGKKADNGLSWEDIDNTRKQLGKIAYDSNADANDVGAAKQAIKGIDGIFDKIQADPEMLANGSPDAVEALKTARAASSTEQQHATIAAMVRKANGNPNALQSAFKNLYNDEAEYNRFSPDNQALIKGIAHPEGIVNNLSTLGKAGVGANGSANFVELAGLLSGNPVAMGLAGTGALVGTGANMIRSKLIRGSTESILKNLEESSIPVSAVKTPFMDAEEEAAMARANQPPPAAPLALPAPSTHSGPIISDNGPIMSVPPNGPSGTIPMSPSIRQNLGQSPATVYEQWPSDLAKAQNAGEASQSDILKQLAARRVMDPSAKAAYIAPREYTAQEVNNILNRATQDKIISAEQRAGWDKLTPEQQAHASSMVGNRLADMINESNQSQRYLADAKGEPYVETEMARAMREALMPSARKYASGGAVDSEPTDAQKAAGNYKKHHVKFNGLDISIENPKGSERKGIDRNGKEWKVSMPDHYGYIKRTTGADGDHVDVYLGQNEHSKNVYVVDQKDAHSGKFDEHKIMLGYSSRLAAENAYKKAFSDKSNRIMKITRMTIPELKSWLKNGNMKKPLHKTIGAK